MKHNNIIPNQHFRKDWQRYVRTWFNQPAKKASRRSARIGKAKTVAPRPLHSLRPIVRCQTIKYNRKVRAGRGFTLDELKAAKINRYAARGLGITVDHRRKNKNEEGLIINANRLKLYKSKLVVFPRNPTSKKVKKGDSSEADLKLAKQTVAIHSLPIAVPQPRLKPRKITKEEQTFEARKTLRKALTDAKLWGAREKRAKDKAAEASGKKSKTADGEGADE